MEEKIIHRAETRGHADYGWLQTYHTFSFANYFDPQRVQFGALRVLNDDRVSPSKGFDFHPHKNMEIISVPLKGGLLHRDNKNNEIKIQHGDVQIMSAGTGIIHSEYNISDTDEVQFLQIWILPDKQDIAPRYDQLTFGPELQKNGFKVLANPDKQDKHSLWINQNAYVSRGTFDTGITDTYQMNDSSNGLYLFVIEGEISIDNETLTRRDGMGLTNTKNVELIFKQPTDLLLLEVPV